jgi:hypothetical protein
LDSTRYRVVRPRTPTTVVLFIHICRLLNISLTHLTFPPVSLFSTLQHIAAAQGGEQLKKTQGQVSRILLGNANALARIYFRFTRKELFRMRWIHSMLVRTAHSCSSCDAISRVLLVSALLTFNYLMLSFPALSVLFQCTFARIDDISCAPVPT